MRNFDAKKHAARLRIARELVLSGLPVRWIAQKLGINPRTVTSSIGTGERTKLSHGTDRFQAVIKNYAYRQLNAHGEEAQQAKALTEEWLELESITTTFRSLNLLINHLSSPSRRPEHRGYIMLLRAMFGEKYINAEMFWRDYLAKIGMGIPPPKNREELEEGFIAYFAEKCRTELAPSWSDDTPQRIDSALQTLLPREAHIIQMRFSIGTDEPVQTLQHIADELKISQERVRQIEQKVLQKLRRPPFSNKLRHAVRVRSI